MTGRDWKRVYHADLEMSGLTRCRLAVRLTDRRFKSYKSLRKTEYYTNCRRDPIGQIVGKLLRIRHRILCDRYQWTIPINVFGEGLAIVHVGTIVVNGGAKVGKNCRIHACTNLGSARTKEGDGAPTLGDSVYIGPGAKLFGPVVIGDHTAIGANAVVNSSFPEGSCSIGGIPARKLSDHTSAAYIVPHPREGEEDG